MNALPSGFRQPGERGAGLVVSALLLFTVIFGGAVREAFGVAAVLEIAACLVVIWCTLDPRFRPMSQAAIWLQAVIAYAAVIAALQLVPLPFEWWSQLPGRFEVVEAFRLIGVRAPSQPVSLAPEQTGYALLTLLPPLAIFILTAKMPFRTLAPVIGWSVVAVAVASAGFAAAQLVLKDFPWPIPVGRNLSAGASGFFVVINHQATLQLMALPFLASILARLRTNASLGDAYQAQALLAVAAIGVAIFGIVAAGSVAGYALLPPVIIACLVIVFGDSRGFALVAGVIGSLALLAAVVFVFVGSPALSGIATTDLGSGPLSRNAIYAHSVEMIQDHLPLGAGLGSFESLYPRYEDPETIGVGFTSFAHNEYLQVAVELGIPGCVALLAFVIWWGAMSWTIWRRPPGEGKRLRQAASIAVAVVLCHSVVDFPARTFAIASLAALCCALMSLDPTRRGEGRARNSDTLVFAHRHVEI